MDYLFHPPQTFEQAEIQRIENKAMEHFAQMHKEAQTLENRGLKMQADIMRERADIMLASVRMAETYATKWGYVEKRFIEMSEEIKSLKNK